VTLKEIALATDVSEATASLALNDRPGVNADTRLRVLQAAREMGYVPSYTAKALSDKNTKLIGLLVPDIRSLFRSRLVQEIEHLFRERGYEIIFATTDNEGKYESIMIHKFVSFRVSCVILYPSLKQNPSPDYLEILKKNNIPLVFLNGRYEGVNAPCVSIDQVKVCQEIVEHLISRGYSHLVYMGSSAKINNSRIKISSFDKAMQQHGLNFVEENFIELSVNNFESAYNATKKLIKEKKIFDSIVTSDTYTAFGAYNALKEENLKVPGDVAVVHFDNLLAPGICAINMTCVEQDIPQMAGHVLKTAEECMSQKKVEDCYITAKLIVRDSTAGKKAE